MKGKRKAAHHHGTSEKALNKTVRAQITMRHCRPERNQLRDGSIANYDRKGSGILLRSTDRYQLASN